MNLLYLQMPDVFNAPVPPDMRTEEEKLKRLLRRWEVAPLEPEQPIVLQPRGVP